MATAVIYDGMDGFENIGETAKNVLKGGAIGAATGLATIFVTNKLPVISHMNPIIKSLVELGIVIGVSALAKDKVGDEVAAAMGVGGASVVLGVAISRMLSGKISGLPAPAAKQGFYGYGEAVAPVVEEMDGFDGTVAPVVETVDGYGYAEGPIEVDVVDGYGQADEEGIVVTVD